MTRALPSSILVLAGTNGSGKSSIAGELLRARGLDYFNPDEITQEILKANPAATRDDANSVAWRYGIRLLRGSIDEREDFVFETTLGGRTVTRLLEHAHRRGVAVVVFYVGLESADLHVARVRARVAWGGHDIPEARIRERYDRSRENLVRLLPSLSELALYDNTEEGDFSQGILPSPRLILHWRDGAILGGCSMESVPGWAKPIVMAVLTQGR